jgi:hypothetical protein
MTLAVLPDCLALHAAASVSVCRQLGAAALCQVDLPEYSSTRGNRAICLQLAFSFAMISITDRMCNGGRVCSCSHVCGS